MPTRSRNARTKARQKRTMSLTKRALKSAAFDANRHFGTVLMLLAAQGGEAVVTSETIREVIPTLRTAEYRTENTDGGVRILIVKPATETSDIEDPVQPEASTPHWTAPPSSVTGQLQEARETEIRESDVVLDTVGYVEPIADAAGA